MKNSLLFCLFALLATVKEQFRRCADRACLSRPCKAHHRSGSLATLVTPPQNAPSSEHLTAPLTSPQTSKTSDYIFISQNKSAKV